MATTAPETTQAGWLDPFLADWRPGTGEPRETREPATGRPLLSLAQSTVEDVARAAVAAAAAQPAWADTSYAERAAVLRRAAEIYEAHRPEFGTWTQRETGAVHGKMHHEQNFAAGEINAAATMPFQPYGQLVPSVVPGRLSMLRRVPAGVIGAITPWNSPTVLGMRVVAPALALGNAVILKPDPQTRGLRWRGVRGRLPRSRAARRAAPRRARWRRGRRGDRDGPQREPACRSPARRRPGVGSGRSRASCSSGSASSSVATTRSWSSTTQTSRRRHRPGRSPRSSSRARSASRPAGTSSTAASRRPTSTCCPRRPQRLRLGDPYREDVDLGPIVNQKQLERVDGIVRRSVEAGARVAVGGTHEGLFYRPTVLTDVTADHAAWREEIFGPVAPVVVFDTDDEALALANDSEYGLTGAVYSSSISRGLALAQRFRSGMVHVNDQTVNDEATIPFGGMGASGNGARFGGPANWDEFTEWQWVTVREDPRSYPYPY